MKDRKREGQMVMKIDRKKIQCISEEGGRVKNQHEKLAHVLVGQTGQKSD